MEITTEAGNVEAAASQELPRPRLSFFITVGIIALSGAAAVYAAYGVSAWPRPEWLIEVLAALIFLIPVFNLTMGKGDLASAARVLGAALLVHSLWDALHWPGFALLDTPIDPWIPQVCPLIDIPIGFWLLLRGR